EFRRLMAFCIFSGLAVMFWTEKKGIDNKMYTAWWYAPLFGLMGGFTTMIGNAAGPVMSVYLLSMRLPKYSFVGTSAWFFLVVNYLKLPLQIFVWDNITLTTVALNALTIPFMITGAIAGIYFVKKVPEKSYRTFIIIVTILSTLMLLF
ncbi:MAG: sulfite exporter TauE/SafE family protein, partial [Tannerellaceae bacterium]|nr:sulfite exporter TauE/SafE family protein [Tannerellaceae bacterium]